MENKKRFYSKEFKEKAVQLSYQGENLKELAGEVSFYQIFKKEITYFQRKMNTILNSLGLVIFGDANVCFRIAKPTKVL